jgi:hypothetical protein
MPQPSPSARRFAAAAMLVLMLTGAAAGASSAFNGFDMTGSLIPPDEVHQGGPPRDGIPAIDRPEFLPVARADHMRPWDEVLGLVVDGRAKAYPVGIMNWHEIVNDRFGDRPIAVTYCPLCGTGIAFDARAAGKELTFGVSGLLYNSDLLLYDRQTESLWSQVSKQAVTGPLKGRKLDMLPLTRTTWSAWRLAHPDTLVLSEKTGYRRDYDRDPYAGYASETGLYFPVSAESGRYHPKEWVLGVEINGNYKAYPFSELRSAGKEAINDVIAGKRVEIRFDRANDSATIHDAGGRQLPAMTAFWFAWYAFHPETAVYTADR